MKHHIKSDKALAEVNTHGAYVDNFEINGKPIFFPKVMVKIGDSLKVRGGMHVCAPNFGADEIFDSLANHGFARDLDWEVIGKSENAISLKLDGIGYYEKAVFELEYEIKADSFLAKLKVTNNSDKDLPLAPGFHPYFYSDHKPFSINGEDLSKDQLTASEFYQAKNLEFSINGLDIKIMGEQNINEYIFWSDFNGDYICVEPTYNSIAFSDSSKDPYMLKPNDIFVQNIIIKIKNV